MKPKYMCPRCQLSWIDPLNAPVKVLCPMYKVPAGSNNSAKFFDVDRQTLDAIKGAGGVLQVQMRCLKLDAEGYEHSWPKHGWLRFNGKQLQPLTQPPENTSARKRKDEPFNVTTLVTSGRNAVEIIQYNDDDVYVGIVFLVNKKKAEKLCDEIKEKKRESIFDSVKRAVDFMKPNENQEVELADKNRRMLIKCPMTYLPMNTPARGLHCDHLDCFNLETWVATNETCKVKKWRCPFCGKKSQEVMIDSLWVQILAEARKAKDPHEVELRPDGAFRVIEFNESKSGLGKLNSIINQVNGKQFEENWIMPRMSDDPVEEESNKRGREDEDGDDDVPRKQGKMDGGEDDPIEL